MKKMHRPLLGIMVLSVLICSLGSKSFSQIRVDESVPDDQKAVIGLNIDLDELRKNKLTKSLLDLAQEGADGDMPFTIDSVSKVSMLVSAPKSMDEESLASVNFYFYIKFNDPAQMMNLKADILKSGGKEIEIGGKQLIDAQNPNFPPGTLLKFYSTSMVGGSRGYMTSPSNQFASKGLADAYAKSPKHPIRIVLDFDGARPVLDQAVEMFSGQVDPIARQYVKMISEISSVSLSSDIGKDTLLKVSLAGKDEAAGDSIRLKLEAALGLAKGASQMIPPSGPGAGAIKAINELKVEGTGANASINIPKPGGFDEIVAAAIKDAQGSAKKFADLNNFKQMALAVHNYHDTHRKLPFEKHAAGEDASKGLSYVVELLPYMEAAPLYERFEKDESYDSESNAELAKTPLAFMNLNSGGRISWVRPPKVPTNLASITDGTSGTIMFVQDRRANLGPWTKPSSITPDQVIAQFKALKPGESLLIGRYDGSAEPLDSTFAVTDLAAMLDPADGKVPELTIDFERPDSASDDDPFGAPKKDDEPFPFDGEKSGAKKSDDPFGGSPKKSDDPFGAPKKSDDPFGGPKKAAKKSDDPFGGSPKKSDDPFGAPKKSDDPFGGPKKAAKKSDDPFGGSPKKSDDPFGAPKKSDDPFGGPKKAAKKSDDPFGGSPKKSDDPFGAPKKSDDPFGGPKKAAKKSDDPFGGSPKKSDDPFGAPKKSDDPFGE